MFTYQLESLIQLFLELKLCRYHIILLYYLIIVMTTYYFNSCDLLQYS